ncbi:unnamed protein product [Vitrella brassicaformis CCMP3155]|uniref:TLDc domain-containing protein n=1 Tax=Vitrella brassicaformis (strain CCMP3155) TaxID=1169540 RepID=A0A0G4G276_VITBC|nr:unnamed protein product [Vitrella brassicaformis CCMP3155]|eukprot:CEM21852.1 unnamed protein product [Vitrella brassicaformis CCMP3155]
MDAVDERRTHNEATKAIYKAIRLQGWSGLRVPRELHVGLYAFVNPLWCLKPPLPSPLSGIVLQHHTELVIDYTHTRQRTFWETMSPQTAYELGQQMINLKCLIRRFPRTPDGAEGLEAGLHYAAAGWCRGIVVALVEGHVMGRQLARDKEGPLTTMSEGSLKSLAFEPVPVRDIGLQEIRRLDKIRSEPPAVDPLQSINLPALTEVKGVNHKGVNPRSMIDGRGWAIPALQRVRDECTVEMEHVKPFITTTRCLVKMRVPSLTPPQMAELLDCIPLEQRGAAGLHCSPLAKLRMVSSIKLYGIEVTEIRDGIRDLQKCLIDRGCWKSLNLLSIEVHRSDCHSTLLNDYATFKVLAKFVDAICSPLATLHFTVHSSSAEDRDIPLTMSLNKLLAYTLFDFGKLPACSLHLLNAALQMYNLRVESESLPINFSPFTKSAGDVQWSPTCHYVWTITPDQLDRSQGASDDSDKARMNELVLEWLGRPSSSTRANSTDRHSTGFSISIECADGWAPPADARPPEPPELNAFKPEGLNLVKNLTVKSRIGLGVAKAVVGKGARLEKLRLMHMTGTDVLGLLDRINEFKMPREVTLESFMPDDGRQASQLPVKLKGQRVKTLLVKGELAMRLVATMRPHMPMLEMLIVYGDEGQVREALVNAGPGVPNRLCLGFTSEGRHEFIKAEDEREGITLGDWKDRMPSIRSVLVHLDVPSANVADAGIFILSSIWSLLEMDANALTVVLPDSPDVSSHLRGVQMAMERRFGQTLGTVMAAEKRFVLTTDDIQAVRRERERSESTYGRPFLSFSCFSLMIQMRKAVFAHSSAADTLKAVLEANQQHTMPKGLTLKRLSSMLNRYFPSLDSNTAVEALASDFAGRMSAAALMTVVDPPYAPRRLKAPLMAAMQRHGLAMEPMLKLYGDGPCIPSPSVITSAAQLMAILQTTGKDITGTQLLYKASEHGYGFADMLNHVDDAGRLLILIRAANGSVNGCFISGSLLPPPQLPDAPTFNQYSVGALVFKASGPSQPVFQSASLTLQYVTVSRPTILTETKLLVGPPVTRGARIEEGLGLWAPDPAPAQGLVPERCQVQVMWGRRTESMLADEIEVMRLQTGP